MRSIGLIWAITLLSASGAACQAKSTALEGTTQSPSQTAKETTSPAPQSTTAPARSAKPDAISPAKTSVTEQVRADDVKSVVDFAEHAFPPTIPDTEWHQHAWFELDCLRCHETGVGVAPIVIHQDMPAILLTAKCRSCHVFIPGADPKQKTPIPPEEASPFWAKAFPPMMPNSESHKAAWFKDDCLLCHETGIFRAPVIEHEGLPEILLKAKCRSCHVQVRAAETGPPLR
ncbi:MAG: hypothetical protein GY842_22035 [bacterium]|nr:hypothetical protein [bacterium]